MERKIIIDQQGRVVVPSRVQMRNFEIAELLGLYTPAAKAAIRSILQSKICLGDFSLGGSVDKGVVYPEYYGLDVVVAVAFRVRSPNAEAFRNWAIQRLTAPPLSLWVRLPPTECLN